MILPFKPSRHSREVLIADWQDAEELAAWYMREVLHLEAVRLTAKGADGGIDVQASGTVTQVKHHSVPIGAPEVQQLKGAGHIHDLVLFFALSDYTQQAVAFAKAASVALFTYSIYGDVEPRNEHARAIIESVPEKVERRAREAAAEQAAEVERRIQEVAAEQAAEVERRIQEAAAERQRQIAAAQQRRRELGALDERVPGARQSILGSVERVKELQDTVRRGIWFRQRDVHVLILAEYASFYRFEGSRPHVLRETGPSLLNWLEMAETGAVVDRQGEKVGVVSSTVRLAISESLALHDSLADMDQLRGMSLVEWVEKLHIWELREAQVEALLRAALVVVGDEAPTKEQIWGLVAVDMGGSLDVREDMFRRWEHGSIRDDALADAEACRRVLMLDTMSLVTQETDGVAVRQKFQRDYVRASPFVVGKLPQEHRFPLGCSPDDIKELRRVLATTAQDAAQELPLPTLLEERRAQVAAETAAAAANRGPSRMALLQARIQARR